MSSSIFAAMSSSTPPFSYPVSSTSGASVPLTFGVSTGPQSSSLSGSGTTFHFGMGSSLVIGSGVSFATTTTTSISTSHPETFSLWSTHIFHNVPFSSQFGAGPSSMGQPFGIVPGSGFPLPSVTLAFEKIQILVFLMGGIGLVVLQ